MPTLQITQGGIHSMRPVNERWRYTFKTYLIWAYTQNYPCTLHVVQSCFVIFLSLRCLDMSKHVDSCIVLTHILDGCFSGTIYAQFFKILLCLCGLVWVASVYILCFSVFLSWSLPYVLFSPTTCMVQYRLMNIMHPSIITLKSYISLHFILYIHDICSNEKVWFCVVCQMILHW